MLVNPWTLSYIRTWHTFVGAHGLLPVHFVFCGFSFCRRVIRPVENERLSSEVSVIFWRSENEQLKTVRIQTSTNDRRGRTNSAIFRVYTGIYRRCTYSIYKHNSDLWVKLLNCGYSRYVFVRALPLLVSRIEFCFCSRKFERNSPVLGTPNTSQTRPVQRSIDRSLDSSALLYSIYSSIFTHASFTNVACITFRFSIFAICKSL